MSEHANEVAVEVMPCLSVRAPWWWWIIYGGKNIENRDWDTDYRGPCAIHASKWWTNTGFKAAMDSAHEMAGSTRHLDHVLEQWTPRKIKNLGGHIVGIVDIVGTATASKSPWFVGKYGFVLANPRPLTPTVPFVGKLGFFKVPKHMLQPGAHKCAPPGEPT